MPIINQEVDPLANDVCTWRVDYKRSATLFADLIGEKEFAQPQIVCWREAMKQRKKKSKHAISGNTAFGPYSP